MAEAAEAAVTIIAQVVRIATDEDAALPRVMATLLSPDFALCEHAASTPLALSDTKNVASRRRRKRLFATMVPDSGRHAPHMSNIVGIVQPIRLTDMGSMGGCPSSLFHAYTNDELIQGAQVAEEVGGSEEIDDAVDTLLNESPCIPLALASHFRTDIMSTGNVGAFRSKLSAAVRDGVQWDGQQYAALKDWTPQAMKSTWKVKPEQDKWEQMVLEMKQVHVYLRLLDAGQLEWDGHGDVEQASFTQVKKAVHRYAVRKLKHGRGRLDYDALIASM